MRIETWIQTICLKLQLPAYLLHKDLRNVPSVDLQRIDDGGNAIEIIETFLNPRAQGRTIFKGVIVIGRIVIVITQPHVIYLLFVFFSFIDRRATTSSRC